MEESPFNGGRTPRGIFFMGNNIFEAFFVYLYRKRWLLIANFIVMFAAACVYAFVILKKEYAASVTFLPPSSESVSPVSLLNFTMPSLSTGGGSSDQIEVIFNSNHTKRLIIDEFGFIEYFKLEESPNKFALASRRLKRYVSLRVAEKGGLGMSRAVSYTLSCYHHSPDTAKMMVDFTFAVIDSAVREISVDKARRNRQFIERQIELQSEKMDSLQTAFLEFQNVNKAYNMPEQARLSLKIYADLKATSLMNELRLSSLKSEFSGTTHEIAELRRNQRVIDAKLKEYETGNDPNVVPSLDLSTRLMPEYGLMARDIEVQNQLVLFLTRECEQARLQESKDISPLIVVDPSFVPEYKIRPARLTIVLKIVLAANLLFLGALTHLFALSHAKRSGKLDSLLKSIKQD